MICVVSPCFNEQEVIPQLYARLTAAAEKWGEPFEVLLVDDGSSDRTWDMLREIHGRDPRWKAIRFARNFGHQNAISAGLHYARGDCVIVLDSDLQDPPEELHHFIDKWRAGYEIVYGIRTKRKEGFVKRICYDAFYKIIGRVADINIPYGSGDFCLMDKKVADLLNRMPERNRFVRGLRSWVGFRQVGVEYERDARAAGEAKYTFRKLFKLAMDGIFSFSGLPLKLATYLGVAATVLAIIVLFAPPITAALAGRSGIAHRASLSLPGSVGLLVLLAGLQLVCLGILGEYMGRIYDEVKGRPLWIVRETLGVELDQ